MAISRPPKALGNDQYTEEVAAGKLDIIDQEIDDDFNTIYDAVNAINNGTIAGKIPYENIDFHNDGTPQGGSIRIGDYAAVDATKLVGNPTGLFGMSGSLLVDRSVDTPKLAIGGANVYLHVTASAQTLPYTLNSAQGEITFGTHNLISRGGPIIGLATVSGGAVGIAQSRLLARIYADGNVIGVSQPEVQALNGSGLTPITAVPLGIFTASPPAGGTVAVSFTLKLQTQNDLIVRVWDAQFLVLELA